MRTGRVHRAAGPDHTGITLAFLAIPIVALFTEVPLRDVPGPAAPAGGPGRPSAVTLRTNLIANALILGFGTPTAWFIARRRLPGRALVVHARELPLVPAARRWRASGLLAAVGTGGLFGSTLRDAGIELRSPRRGGPGGRRSSPSPFYIRQAISCLRVGRHEPDRRAPARWAPGPGRTFWRIGLPLAASGLLAGWVLAFARGVGEFGATDHLRRATSRARPRRSP
jgi:molybdate transport system permease protein